MGLDGATFDVIDKFKDNELVCLRRIINRGVRGILQSTFPPVTGPAWVACATGKNPGKTGVFDFLNRTTIETYGTRRLSSAEFKRARSFWDYLNNNGIRVGIWNYPMLYPPYPINGFMISGLGCSPDDDFTYPKALKQALFNMCDEYAITVPYNMPQYANNPWLFVTNMMKLLDQNEATIEFLTEQGVEVFVGVISATDFAQHYMWKFLDKTHPLYEEKKAAQYRPAFLRIWQRVDKIVGNMLAKMPSDTDILIVSDHGFGAHKQSFYINSWLESEGYLVRKKSGTTFVADFQPLAARTIDKVAILSPQVSAILNRIGRKYARPFLSQIAMEKTVAFAAPHATNSGQIYLNTLPESPIQSSEARNSIKEEIAQRLRNTCEKLNMKTNIYFSGDIYSGEFLQLAPNILFEINNFECSVHYEFGKSIYKSMPHNPNHSGSHRKNGIFIAYGSDVKQGIEVINARIYDIAPTILHMFGLPVPDDMDGRVLKEIFREGSEPARREVRYRQVDPEREKVRQSIRKLRKSKRL